MASGLVVSTAKHTSGAFWQLSQCLANVPQWRASRCDPGLCVNRHYLGQRCVVMQTGTMVCRGYSRRISLSDLVIYSHTMARGRQKGGGAGKGGGGREGVIGGKQNRTGGKKVILIIRLKFTV